MRRALLCLCTAAFLFGCSGKSQEWRLIPGKSAGSIKETTDEKTLIELYGEENVKRKKIHIGEGQFLNGHILFEGKKNECELLWVEDMKPPVDRLILTSKKGSWHLENGLAVGTTLDELNEINGRPFLFYGFAWDLGGLVISWENGNMNSVANDSLVVYLSVDEDDNIPNELIGDSEISSDNPALAELKIIVSKIEILLQSSQPKTGVILAKSGLVLRDSPALDGLRQASIPYDAEVEIIDAHGPMATIDDITGHWIKVRYRQFEGWVFGGYVDVLK